MEQLRIIKILRFSFKNQYWTYICRGKSLQTHRVRMLNLISDLNIIERLRMWFLTRKLVLWVTIGSWCCALCCIAVLLYVLCTVKCIYYVWSLLDVIWSWYLWALCPGPVCYYVTRIQVWEALSFITYRCQEISVLTVSTQDSRNVVTPRHCCIALCIVWCSTDNLASPAYQ